MFISISAGTRGTSKSTRKHAAIPCMTASMNRMIEKNSSVKMEQE